MNVFSIDLEDWFHLLDTSAAPSRREWAALESRVERNAHALLTELDVRGIRATFFVLGWIAERYPALVREVAERGHELASHGHAHELVYEIGRDAFREDLRRSKAAIEDAAGVSPKGYRAPGFSITWQTPWAFDVLLEEGFEYDSSVFPSMRAHGGMTGAEPLPSRLPNGIDEYPISTVKLAGTRMSYLGGGYLRLMPRRALLRLARGQVRRSEPLILYIHPRDIDPGQPRMPLGLARSLRSYVGLDGCLDKVRALLDEFEWGSFHDLRAGHAGAAS
jgi:polysaccharide deacetylase family protein (PEP-CTERM system associated)